MSKTLKFIALLAIMVCFTACGGDENGGSTTVDSREIVYTVNSRVNRTTLNTDAEWDELLELFCTYSSEGQTVTFFSNHTGATPSGTKEATSISTTSREEMKRWMRSMERAGKTVTVTYDEATGTWNGTAYVNGPQAQADRTCYTGTLTQTHIPSPSWDPVWTLQVSDDTVLVLTVNGLFIHGLTSQLEIGGEVYNEGDEITLCGNLICEDDGTLRLNLTRVDASDIVGRWHYYMMYTFSIGVSPHGELVPVETIYTPESVGTSIYFDFREDGTMTYTRHPAGSTDGGISNEGSWNLSADGELCCQYFDGNTCWTIAGVANGVMGLYALPAQSTSGEFFYQMELHAVR